MIRAKIIPDTTAEAAGKTAVEIRKRLPLLVAKTMERARSNIAERTPVGHSSALRGGWASATRTLGTKTVGVVANPIVYTDIRDKGRRPGRRPPVAALMPWVGSKLGIPPGPEREAVAFLVARKIGRAGYEGANMIDDGWKATQPALDADLAKLGLRVIRMLDS